MSRLDNCLGKVSKLINKSDAALLKKEVAAYEAEGMTPIQAASKATQDALEDVNKIYKNTLKAASKAAPSTLPAIKAYWEGKPLVVSELPASHKKLAKELFDQGVKTETQITKALGEENAKWAKPFANHIAQNETLFQASKGQVNFSSVGKAIITILEEGDVSTVFHEYLHLVRRTILSGKVAGVTDNMVTATNKFVGAKDNKWTREQEEKFARAGERHLREGINTGIKAVDDFLGVLTGLMRSIYTTVTGSDIDVELTPEIRAVFDQLFTRGETLREQGVEPTRVQGELNIEAATSNKPKPKPKLPALKKKAPLIGPRRAIGEALRKEFNLKSIGATPQGFTEKQLAEDALADIAEAKAFDASSPEEQKQADRPPRVGRELVTHLLDNMELQAKPRDTALLTYEVLQTRNKIKSLQTKLEKDGNDTLEDDLQATREYLQQVLDLLYVRGSRAGSALRAYRNVYNEQFDAETMAAAYYGWKNRGKSKDKKWEAVTKAEREKIEAQSKEILQRVEENLALEKKYQESIAAQERLQIENLLLKSKKPRKAPVRKSTTDRVAERVLTARERLAELGYGSRTLQQGKKGQIEFEGGSTLYQDGNTLEPEALEAFSEIAADLMLKGMSEKQIISELGNEFQEVIADHGTEILAAAHQLLNKLSKSSSKKSPQELAALADPNEKLSRQMVYNMYRGLLEKDFRGDAVVNEILRLLNPTMPEVTFNDVVDAFTSYGIIKFPSQQKLDILLRKERKLQLVSRQLGEVREKRLYKLTGLQRDRLDPNDPLDQEIRKLTEERNQLMRDMKLTEDSADKTLARGTLSAIKTHLKNDLVDLQKAIDTQTELVKKEKRAPDTDPELLELRAQKKAKRAEYNAAFGINIRQLSQEQRLKAADKALDKSLAREEKMALEDILKRPAGTPQIKTPAMVAKAAKIKALQDARHAETRRLAQEVKELLNPPKTDAEKWNAKQAKQLEKTIENFEYYRTHSKYPDKTPGVAYTREQFVEELLKTKNDLKVTVAEMQRKKNLMPRDVLAARRKKKLIKKLKEITTSLEEQLKTGKFKTTAPNNKNSDIDVVSIRNTNKALREAVLQLKKADPAWIASYEAKLDESLTKASDARTAKWEQRLRDKDFSDSSKIQREPSKALDLSRLKEHKAKNAWLEQRLKLNFKNAPFSDRFVKTSASVSRVVNAGVLGLDLAFGRQGIIPALTNPKLAAAWLQAIPNASEAGELALYRRLSDPAQNKVAYEMGRFKNKQYKLYAPTDEHTKKGNEDIIAPELLEALQKFLRRAPTSTLNFILKNSGARGRLSGEKIVVGRLVSSPIDLLIVLERINRMVHNTMADALAAQQLGKKSMAGLKEITKADVDLAANTAMVAVRRGSFRNEEFERGFPLAHLFLISGRYLVSGLQIATFQPLWTARGGYTGTIKARGAVAWNLYLRTLLTFSAVAFALGKAAFGDDEEKWERYINPLDNKFMVLEFNGIEYNFLKAMTPYISILSKLAMGYKVTNGKVVRLRGKGSQWGRTAEDEFNTFIGNRRSLRLGLAYDTAKGKHFDGSDVTAWSLLKKSVTNINIQNDLKILEHEQAPPVQKALSIVVIHAALDAQIKRAEKAPTSSSSSKGIKKLVIKPLSKQK